jgi:hypothetical protein
MYIACFSYGFTEVTGVAATQVVARSQITAIDGTADVTTRVLTPHCRSIEVEE